MAEWDVLPYVLMLSYHHTVLLPTIEAMLEKSVTLGGFLYEKQMKRLLDDNTRFHRSDGMCWTMYFMNKHGLSISDKQADAVVCTRDCLGLLMLYLSGHPDHQNKVIDFANSLDQNDLHGLDQYWLLLYQLFHDDNISNPYGDENAFEILKSAGVSFVKDETTGDGEA